MRAARTSSLYGIVQTVLLGVFAGAVLFARGPLLFAGLPAARTAGGVLCLAGVLLLVAGVRAIGRSIQIAPAPKADATLAMRGVYKWFRHPIYSAILVIVVGLFLRQPTVPVLIVAVAVIVFLVMKVRFEEALLLARYPEYRDYKRRTWGIIPFLKS